jgi:transmembrane sensor
MTQDMTDEAEALDWTIRVQRPDFEDWDGLTAWLAADPRNADNFHRMTLLDDEVAGAVRDMPAEPISQSAAPVQPALGLRSGRRPPAARNAWRSWGLLAASTVLVVGLGVVGFDLLKKTAANGSSTVMAIVTRPGERRDLRLRDGVQVAVAGGTRLAIDEAAHRVDLTEGQATFSVVHDPRRTFSVRLGDATVVDVGTVFDLRRRDGRNTVAVAEGEVRVDGTGAPVEVAAGRRLRFGGGATELEAIAPEAVGGWRRGRFTYADAPVSEVAADIAAATGAEIRVSPKAAAQRFAGTISIGGDTGQALRSAAPVMGLSVARAGDVWVLGPAHDSLQRQ